MQQKIEKGTVNADRIDLQNYVVQLNTDDLIELAETGKVRNIELDDMAKEVFNECAYMLKFEKNCYLKERNKNVEQLRK